MKHFNNFLEDNNRPKIGEGLSIDSELSVRTCKFENNKPSKVALLRIMLLGVIALLIVEEDKFESLSLAKSAHISLGKVQPYTVFLE